MKMKQALRCSITTDGRWGAFMALHYYIPAGQAKVPNSNMAVVTEEENVPGLWKKTNTGNIVFLLYIGGCKDTDFQVFCKE